MGTILFPKERQATLSGSIAYLTGTTLPFSGEDALSFSGINGVHHGLLPGAVVSQNCTLLLYDRDHRYTAGRSLFGAKVTVQLEMEGASFPLAVFFVSSISQNDGSSFLTLTGSDALGCAFDGLWEDTLSYPQTLGSLAQSILEKAGFSLEAPFPGQDMALSRRPDWGERSLRSALGLIAQASGCFCQVSGEGKVQMLPAWQQEAVPYEIFPEQTFKRVYDDATFGPLTGIQVALKGAPKNAAPLTVKRGETPLDGFNSLSIGSNPLFTYGDHKAQELAQHVLSSLSGMTLTRLKVHWQGDAQLSLGKRIRVWDTKGGYTDTCVTSLSCTVDHQGFSMQTDCLFQGSASSIGRLFTDTGGLNAALLQGSSDGSFLKAESITAQHLAGQSVTAEKLSAGSVTAEKIATGSITADKLAAGAIDADSIRAVKAELQRLVAEGIVTDELYVALSTIANAQIETADIDFSHVKDLVTDQAIITEGVGNQLYIARLAVTEANMVSLSVGELIVKGTDGSFYAVGVDAEGKITTEKKQIGNDDVQNLSIHAGEKLIEGSVTAKTLNVQDIFADSAIIREMIAAHIDVDTLFAREATIDRINALDIRGNRYLKLTVDGLSEEMVARTGDATGQQMTLTFDRGGALETGKQTITCQVNVWKNGTDVTEQIPLGAFSWQRISGDTAADSAWAESHRAVKTITLSRSEIGKSCQVSCTLNAKGYYGYFNIVDGVLQIEKPDDGAADAFSLEDGNLYGEESYYVDKDGYLYRRNVPGQMTVTSTVFDHTILETSHILIKDEKIEISSGGDVHVKAGGTFTVDSGNFNIDSEGNVQLKGRIEAGSGKIGGWDIQPGSLQSGTDTAHVRLSTEDETFGIWAGADEAENAPFRVARDGTVYLTKLYVTDENGVARPNPVNLQQSYWMMDSAYYANIVSVSAAGPDAEGNITLTFNRRSGAPLTVNFKKPSQVVNLEGEWSGTTWTVTASPGEPPKTLSTTISLSQAAWNSQHKKMVHVYANNSPTYLIQMEVDGSEVYTDGYVQGRADGMSAGENAYKPTSILRTDTDGSDGKITVRAANQYQDLLTGIEIDVSDVYQAGWDAAVAALTLTGGISAITNTAPNTYYASGSVSAYVDGEYVKSINFNKTATFQ